MSSPRKNHVALLALCTLVGAVSAFLVLREAGSAWARFDPGAVGLGLDHVSPSRTGQTPPDRSSLAYTATATDTFLFFPFTAHHWPPLPLPATLNPIANADGDGVYTVAWPAVQFATTYSLEEDDSPAFASPTEVFNGTATSWTVPAPGRIAGTYYYRLRGHNAWGFGRYSNVVGVVVLLPDTPVLNPIDNADGNGDYIVTWGAAARATGYTLQEDTEPDFGSPTTVFQGAGTAWSASGKAVASYFYRVGASGPTGSSDWSNVQTTTVGRFRADSVSLLAGQCTTLRWNFTGIKALYISFGYGYDREGVAGQGSRQVCPSVTTPYEALVVKLDNSHERHYVTVHVSGTGCGDPVIQRFTPTSYVVAPGEPFSIFWDVECASSVHLTQGSGAEEPVVGHGSRIDVRVYVDTLFKLRVRKFSGEDVYASFTVQVTALGSGR